MKINKRLDKMEAYRRSPAWISFEEYDRAMDIIGLVEIVRHREELIAKAEQAEQETPWYNVEYNTPLLAWVLEDIYQKMQSGWLRQARVVSAYVTVWEYCRGNGLDFEEERKRALDNCLSVREGFDQFERADHGQFVDWFERHERQATTDKEKQTIEILRKEVERIRQIKIRLGVDKKWVGHVLTWEEYEAQRSDI